MVHPLLWHDSVGSEVDVAVESRISLVGVSLNALVSEESKSLEVLGLWVEPSTGSDVDVFIAPCTNGSDSIFLQTFRGKLTYWGACLAMLGRGTVSR